MLDLLPLIAIAVALVVGIFTVGGDRDTAYFRIALWVAFAVELSALILRECGLYNMIVYNAYMPVEFGLLLAYANFGRVSLWTTGVFAVCFSVFWWVDLDNGRLIGQRMATVAFIVSASVLSAAHCIRLVQLANTTMQSLLWNGEFWARLSIVLYGSCMIPGVGLQRYLYSRGSELASDVVTIFQLLATIRYTLAFVAIFLWGRSRMARPCTIRMSS